MIKSIIGEMTARNLSVIAAMMFKYHLYITMWHHFTHLWPICYMDWFSWWMIVNNVYRFLCEQCMEHECPYIISCVLYVYSSGIRAHFSSQSGAVIHVPGWDADEGGMWGWGGCWEQAPTSVADSKYQLQYSFICNSNNLVVLWWWKPLLFHCFIPFI